jgi:hypothetical protein
MTRETRTMNPAASNREEQPDLNSGSNLAAGSGAPFSDMGVMTGAAGAVTIGGGAGAGSPMPPITPPNPTPPVPAP